MPKTLLNTTQPLCCEKCGSRHFHGEDFVPGDPVFRLQLQPERKRLPIQVLICLCGHPVWPATIRPDSKDPKISASASRLTPPLSTGKA